MSNPAPPTGFVASSPREPNVRPRKRWLEPTLVVRRRIDDTDSGQDDGWRPSADVMRRRRPSAAARQFSQL